MRNLREIVLNRLKQIIVEWYKVPTIRNLSIYIIKVFEVKLTKELNSV